MRPGHFALTGVVLPRVSTPSVLLDTYGRGRLNAARPILDYDVKRRRADSYRLQWPRRPVVTSSPRPFVPRVGEECESAASNAVFLTLVYVPVLRGAPRCLNVRWGVVDSPNRDGGRDGHSVRQAAVAAIEPWIEWSAVEARVPCQFLFNLGETLMKSIKYIAVAMTPFSVLLLGDISLCADIQVHTADFIPDAQRTNFNSFETLPAVLTTTLPGLDFEDGTRVEPIASHTLGIVTLWWWSGNVGDPRRLRVDRQQPSRGGEALPTDDRRPPCGRGQPADGCSAESGAVGRRNTSKHVVSRNTKADRSRESRNV